jgi:two-component system, NarL family, response regulator LiaR
MTAPLLDSHQANGRGGHVPDDSIRVLIAHGDGLARNALRDAMSGAGISVVGQSADASEAIRRAARSAPDVVIIDAALPPDGGLAAMRALVAAVPASRVVLLAASDADDTALLALSQGAAGYLPRDIDLSSLARAVEGVALGEAAISRPMAGRLIEYLRKLSAGLAGMRPVRSPLTTREWEILEFLKAGASTTQIADELIVSTDTVRTHIQHILRKLQAHSRAEAVEIAERFRVPLGMSG